VEFNAKETIMKKASVKIASIVALSFCLMAVIPAQAGDNGLYASAPPAGSAFVRFVSAEGGRLKGNVRGKDFPALSAGQVGAYAPVSPGKADIALGQVSVNYDLKPGHLYIAALSRGKLAILEEPANDNKLKTQIVLLNLSSHKNVSLKTTDGSVSVIDSVESGKLGVRPVNAIKTGFSIYAGGTKISSLAEKSLERGAGYTVVVYDSSNGPAVSFGQATGS
jgi:alginate O-acetyltransferase complex protein AlgF